MIQMRVHPEHQNLSTPSDSNPPRQLLGQRPIFFGFTTTQMACIAREAMEDAVAETANAGVALTGMVDGRIQTLAPSDPRIQSVVTLVHLRKCLGSK